MNDVVVMVSGLIALVSVVALFLGAGISIGARKSPTKDQRVRGEFLASKYFIVGATGSLVANIISESMAWSLIGLVVVAYFTLSYYSVRDKVEKLDSQ